MKYRRPPGVFDIIPNSTNEPWRNSHIWQYVESIIRNTAKDWGYQEIRTPMFERAELFQRGVGETSDIVSKEMYIFEDKGKRLMALRPEGTAPVMRAFLENNMADQTQHHKLFYIAPMFRYDRPQAGRYRQHVQFGAEAIGNNSPEQDVELIDLIYTLYSRLGLKNLTVYLNSLGDPGSRIAYREALRKYLEPLKDKLSEDSIRRLEKNPLRILDSKDPKDREISKGAPSILEHLSEEEMDHFQEVQNLLNVLKIPFEINTQLVRGLDYYNRTVFEVVTSDLGAQNSIGAGGRYDGLMKSFGGPDLPAIGFGSGLERIIQTLLSQGAPIPDPIGPTLYIIPLGEAAKEVCYPLLHTLRSKGISSQMDFTRRKLGKMMQYADQIRAQYIVVIGDDELKKQTIELKNMETGDKTRISIHSLAHILTVESKSEPFMQLWAEMTEPFRQEDEASFFLKKVNNMIAETQELTTKFEKSLNEIKKLLQE